MSYILTVTLNPCIDRTIVFDGFSVGSLNRALSERTDVGGKGINVSKVLKKMECPSIATGIVFGDVGRSILTELDELDIRHDFVISENGNSRQNLKLLDKNTGDVTEIGGIGGEADEELLQVFLEKYTSLLDEASLTVLSGSAPKGVPRDIYATLTALAREKGVRVILDADGELLKNGIPAAPYMIKPNVFELNRLMGKDIPEEELSEAAQSLLESGTELVVVSRGKDGSLFVTKDRILSVSAIRVEGGCATGAGDSMVAASAYGIANGFELTKLARYASAAGSATASKEGTEVCDMQDILLGADKVKVKP